MKDISSLAVGFIAGAFIGMVAGLLYAPHSGRYTREMVREQADGARGRAGRLIRDAREFGEDALERAEDIIEKAKERMPG